MRIRLLTLIFDDLLPRSQIPHFRGALIDFIGPDNVLFHNHEGTSFLYRYPKIQYKALKGRAALVCLNEGIEEAIKLFQHENRRLNLVQGTFSGEVAHVTLDFFDCCFSENEILYELRNWFALNESNFQRFCTIPSREAQIQFLERILVGNILSFGKSIKWRIEEEIEIKIIRIIRQRYFNFKNRKMIGFDIHFRSNVGLPDNIGLGKSVARGFGVLQRQVS